MARLKRVPIFQIRSWRFRSLFPTHVVIAKPLHSFARHALGRWQAIARCMLRLPTCVPSPGNDHRDRRPALNFAR
ncbi:hypothetical protein E0H70_22400 [Rhizobium leguminosarum bv. viciae]|nr:hypothetical protein E0H70_22400 [Rhizobium leguminosarum bv. viciae]